MLVQTGMVGELASRRGQKENSIYVQQSVDILLHALCALRIRCYVFERQAGSIAHSIFTKLLRNWIP